MREVQLFRSMSTVIVCHWVLAVTATGQQQPASRIADVPAGPESVIASEAAAFGGTPLGVGELSVRFADDIILLPDVPNLRLADADKRILYAVIDQHGSSRSAPKKTTTRKIVIRFLFRGDQPLDVTLATGRGQVLFRKISIQRDESARKRLMDKWWQDYTAYSSRLAKQISYPMLVDQYLVTMLRSRFGLPEVPMSRRWHSSILPLDDMFEVMLGAESVRLAMQNETFLKQSGRSESPTHKFPQGTSPPAVTIPSFPGDVTIEPIAFHVPADCFYIHCEKFSDFLWLKSNLETWGSRIRDLATAQGLDYGLNTRVQRQLGLQETALARMFGDAAVSEVALIGADIFLREGAALGVIFKAKNSDLLTQQLAAQRRIACDKFPDVSERELFIEGHSVSLISSPFNRVRSFHAADGQYHLVTNSHALVRDFFRASRGENCLGELQEFRYARHRKPLSGRHTAFIYLSDPFFRRLVSPQYRVEMTRRLQALTESNLVHMARLAAQAENRPHETMGDLIAGGFLPENFEQRPDGSRAVILPAANGDEWDVVDSLRGAAGSYLPVPDIELSGMTATELRAYQKFARRYAAIWRRMDPVIVSIDRTVPDQGYERIVFDAYITPYAQERLGFLVNFLAPPTTESLSVISNDLVTIQVHFHRIVAALVANAQPKTDPLVFLGLHDADPPFQIVEGEFVQAGDNFEASGYLGVHPIVHLNEKDSEEPPDQDGYRRPRKGHHWLTDSEWIREFGDFRVRATDRWILESVTPQLQLIEAERPAQIRARVANLVESKAARAINAATYLHARRISATNAQLLNHLADQLQLDPQRARDVVERIYGAKLTCPLDGQYQLVGSKQLGPHWRSTAWSTSSFAQLHSTPENYRAEFLNWFRGLEVEFSIDRTSLTTRAELLVNPPAQPRP